MIFYKMRHIPTGMFYKPSKHRSKSNLSKKGKVYQMKPTFKWIGRIYHHPIEADMNLRPWERKNYESRPFVESDWEIIKYNTED